MRVLSKGKRVHHAGAVMDLIYNELHDGRQLFAYELVTFSWGINCEGHTGDVSDKPWRNQSDRTLLDYSPGLYTLGARSSHGGRDCIHK